MNRKKSIKFIIQQRVGYLSAIGTLSISLYNIFFYIINSKMDVISAILAPSSIFVIIFAFPFLLTTLKDSNLLRIIQISILCGIGLFAIFLNEPNSLVEVYLFVGAIILGIQYDILKKHFPVKIIITFLLFTISKLISGYLYDPKTILKGLPSIISALIYLNIIWVAFAEEIKEHIKENKELKQQIDQNEIFVTFGKNVTAIIHNLKNKMMAIQNFNELIPSSTDSEITKLSQLQNVIILETYQLITNLTFAVKSKQDVNQKTIALNKLIKSVVDLYNSNPKFLKEVKVDLDLIEDDYIFISPSEVSQLLDNLLINSWEAKKENTTVQITIKTEKNNDMVKLLFKDNGIGIKFCGDCTKKKCLNCKQFYIGKSTKEHGSGIGMVYIMSLINELNGKIRIDSKMNEGTTIEILFHAEKKEIEYIID